MVGAAVALATTPDDHSEGVAAGIRLMLLRDLVFQVRAASIDQVPPLWMKMETLQHAVQHDVYTGYAGKLAQEALANCHHLKRTLELAGMLKVPQGRKPTGGSSQVMRRPQQPRC
jgi:hypothetical protein